jgi:MFS family permease
MKAITLWGAASAAGAALGPVVGGVLADTTGWQGLFWIDAAVAAACIPLTLFTVQESRDANRSHSIDLAGTVLIAAIFVPLVLALSEGTSWGWISLPTIACVVIAVLSTIGFVYVERRVKAPLVNLDLLRNRILVGSTIAILLVAGAINALMYVLSLYFQDPSAFGLSALQAGFATLPAAAAMIAVTPLITPVAVRIGSRNAVAVGFGLAAVGFAVLVFVTSSWSYAVFVAPLVAIAVGLGLANGPASSASTASVGPDEVGAASGISNMARYVGGSLAVAAVATVYNAVTIDHRNSGASAADSLAAGLSRSSLVLAIASLAGVALAVLLGRHRLAKSRVVDRAAAAAVVTHTIPTDPVTSA